MTNGAILATILGGLGVLYFWKRGGVGNTLPPNPSINTIDLAPDYIANAVYKDVLSYAVNRQQVIVNRDRIFALIRTFRADIRSLIQDLRAKRITPAEFRIKVRALAEHIHQELDIARQDMT